MDLIHDLGAYFHTKVPDIPATGRGLECDLVLNGMLFVSISQLFEEKRKVFAVTLSHRRGLLLQGIP